MPSGLVPRLLQYSVKGKRRQRRSRKQWQDSPTSTSPPSGRLARLTPRIRRRPPCWPPRSRRSSKRGDRDAARERFGALVALLQRRAVRIAFQYLRDAADADEAVQDAFVKVFLHIEQYRSDLPFDVWFTRILVNAALDRLKARGRQQRWISHSTDEDNGRPVEQVPATEASHERRLAREGTVGAGHQRRGGPARSAATGVYALSPRRADAGGDQRRDRDEPGHGARAFVQGVAEVDEECWEVRHEPTRHQRAGPGRRTRGVSGRRMRGGRCALRRSRARNPAPQDPRAAGPSRASRQGHPVPQGREQSTFRRPASIAAGSASRPLRA